MSDLSSLKLISGRKIIDHFHLNYSDALTYDYESPSDFMNEMWSRYDSGQVSMNGSVFEGLLATILYREGISPIYIQANLAFVPNVNFDFVVYTKEVGPIVLSAKTSLRERYKQADLEGMMLRQVHRKSECYLITLNKNEARSVQKKINEGQVLGLDKVYLADENGFNELVEHLKSFTLYQPDKIDIITSKRIISGK